MRGKKRLFDLCCVSTGARPHIRYAHCQIPVLADQAGGSSGHIFETGNCGYVALLTEVHTGHLHGRTQHCSLCPLNKDVPHLSWARLLKSMIQTPPMPQTDLLTAHLLSPAQEDLHPDNGHNPRNTEILPDLSLSVAQPFFKTHRKGVAKAHPMSLTQLAQNHGHSKACSLCAS